MFRNGDIVRIIPGDDDWVSHVSEKSFMFRSRILEMIEQGQEMEVIDDRGLSSSGRILVITRDGLFKWHLHPSCLKLVNNRCVFDV